MHTLGGQRPPVLTEPLLGVVLRGEHRAHGPVQHHPVGAVEPPLPGVAPPPGMVADIGALLLGLPLRTGRAVPGDDQELAFRAPDDGFTKARRLR